MLASALNTFSKSSESLIRFMDDFENLRKNILEQLQTELQVKRDELRKMEDDFERETRQRKIQMDDDVRAHGIDAVKRILDERKLVAVDKEGYELYKRSHEELKENYEADVAAAVSKKADDLEYKHKTEIDTLRLRFSAEKAKLEAMNEQLEKANDDLRNEVAAAEKRLNDERSLIEKVANACKPQPVIQHLGKGSRD